MWDPDFGDEFWPMSEEELAPFARDSLGQHCMSLLSKLDEAFADPGSVDMAEGVRAYGILGLRARRSRDALGPRCRASALASPGMKVRVMGVPDALTFIEGDWIRRSVSLLPKEHWPAQRFPKAMELRRGVPGTFFSLDLSKATDGIHHDAVRAVVLGMSDAGCIRQNGEFNLALSSLGLEPKAEWHYSKSSVVSAERGSPMGTPLSFPVLSLINAWSCQAFDHCATHGDDAVAFAPFIDTPLAKIQPVEILNEYAQCIEAVGGSVNRAKTFASQSSWTACEILARKMPATRGRSGWYLFFPPPCAAPGLAAPVASEGRTTKRFLIRQERVMKTLFPWVNRDLRLHLPVEIGGLGYTGRGLRVSKNVRRRLGTLVSLGVDYLVARDLSSKGTFREEGLYPRPLVPTPREGMAGWYAVEKQFPTVDQFRDPSGVSVPVSDLVAHRSRLVYNEYRFLCGFEDKRRRDGGRPTKTKRSAVFKAMKRGAKLATPLSVKHGVTSLIAFAARCKSLTTTVDPDVASQILGRTQDPQVSF
jgi:hypothetical protein